MYDVSTLPMRTQPKTSVPYHLQQFLLHFLFFSSLRFALILIIHQFFFFLHFLTDTNFHFHMSNISFEGNPFLLQSLQSSFYPKESSSPFQNARGALDLNKNY